ncbi:MAG: hypothetical protein ACC645_12105, partial [Pirellulales bacterium]
LPGTLELPERTSATLEALRRRVWKVKLAEGMLAAAFGLLLSYLLVFLLDRVWDTPAWLRGLLLLAGAAGLGIALPLKWHRWVWRTRRLEQVARLVGHTFPRLGDQLLGVVELAERDTDRQRSESLCRAAMRQVDQAISRHDFSRAVPHPRHRRWAWAAAVPALLAFFALLLVPAAGTNALLRWLLPWRATDRYTFAQLDPLPEELVVPYAEPFMVSTSLSDRTAWSPRHASARYGSQQRVGARLEHGGYTFRLPPQSDSDTLTLAVGDARKSVAVRPTTRPELTRITARITLPDYLGYARPIERDIRGGTLSAVRGSRAVIAATATRELAEASLDATRLRIDGARLVTEPIDVRESAQRTLTWRDRYDLAGKGPFVLSLKSLDDQPPTIACRKLSPEQVLLDEEVLTFQIHADDDFGVREVGLEWAGIEDTVRNPQPVQGEKVIVAGQPEATQLDAPATFSAERDGVPPQSLRIRLYATDYLPGRKRVYSPTYIVHVLSPEDHAIWLTNQLRRWFRQAVDVQQREQRLYQTNRELRALAPDAIDRPDNRRRIETQAAAEATNGRRLAALTTAGEALIRQAMRNDQFNVATLETWAETLKALEAIAQNRMPSVADLLKRAADAPRQVAEPPSSRPPTEPSDSRPRAAVVRDTRSADPSKPEEKAPDRVPSIQDVESSFNEPDAQKEPASPAPAQQKRFTLPSTTIVGGGPPQDQESEACPAEQKMTAAVEEQEDLLAEFAKVVDQLQRILDNLEGSTFVKRLKAASRRQLDLARDINRRLTPGFGVPEEKVPPQDRGVASRIAEREVAHSDVVYLIQDDLEAYYNRVRQGKFKTVVNEMKKTQVVRKVREVSEMVADNLAGQSIAEAEFWADTLDRWAEQLVGPG